MGEVVGQRNQWCGLNQSSIKGGNLIARFCDSGLFINENCTSAGLSVASWKMRRAKKIYFWSRLFDFVIHPWVGFKKKFSGSRVCLYGFFLVLPSILNDFLDWILSILSVCSRLVLTRPKKNKHFNKSRPLTIPHIWIEQIVVCAGINACTL